MPLPSWPPEITEEQLQQLRLQATTYALAHGLLYLPPIEDGQLPPVAPSSAIHAPFALFPTPFPRNLFARAQSLQQIYNVLYARVASDEEFLDRILNAETAIGCVDEFVGELWRIWKEVRNEKPAQVLQLGIFRSDYLLHESENKLEIKQVEFNTIAAAGGTQSQNVNDLHRYLLAATGYYACSDLLTPENVPENSAITEVVQGLVHAHKAYLEIDFMGHTQNDAGNVYILFVVQPNERNIFDQRHLEYELLQTHGIRVIRRTFDELEEYSRLSNDNRALLISTSIAQHPIEISVVYYRTGLLPTDYPSHRQFETRKLIERSRAIKCPSLALQLAGCKKVQAVLSRPGVVESFIIPERWRDNPYSFTSKTVDELRGGWVEMWGLEEQDGVEKARRDASSLVLKPQREGGGNNIYKLNIPPFLDKLPEREKEAWIAMALIHVPKGVQNILVRSGMDVVKTNIVSELGIFGWALFGYENDASTESRKLRLEEGSGGYLLRTKREDSDEGGVATGSSVLDSIILVD